MNILNEYNGNNTYNENQYTITFGYGPYGCEYRTVIASRENVVPAIKEWFKEINDAGIEYSFEDLGLDEEAYWADVDHVVSNIAKDIDNANPNCAFNNDFMVCQGGDDFCAVGVRKAIPDDYCDDLCYTAI